MAAVLEFNGSTPHEPRAQHEDGANLLISSSNMSYQHLQPSGARPVSSIYSQPSPKMRQGPHGPRLDIPRASSVYPDDVSPPDSPRTIDGARSSSPNISPITDAGSGHHIHSANSKPYVSNIPLPTKPSSGGRGAFITGWKEKIAAAQAAGKVKWDDYSGEPTNSDKGKSSQVEPGATPFHHGGTGTVTTVTSNSQPKQSMFSTTLRKVGKKDVPSSPPPLPREEWKGASGREAIVPPVSDRPGKNKAFPTPSQRRQKQHGLRQASGRRSAGEEKSHVQDVSNRNLGDNNGRSSPAQQSVGRRSLPKSDVPMETAQTHASRHKSPQRPESTIMTMQPITESPMTTGSSHEGSPSLKNPNPNTSDQVPPPLTKRATEPIPRKPSPLIDRPPRISSLPPGQDSLENELYTAARNMNMNMNSEPVSRFSVTTYATDNSPSLPPQSSEDMPPVPPLTTSILDRKRPVPSAGVGRGINTPTRKPTPSDLKSLPQQPPEEEAVDRVTLLEAKLTSLNRRKGELQAMINELTQVVQPSSISYDIASRQEIKKVVETWNTESAAVAKEIHETGLKLHRALKKRDENGAYEPTGLWVRRVTE